MDDLPLSAAPCGLEGALRERGFDAFTPIQTAVLQADAGEQDLRITSQTGSGKTIAVGLAVAEAVDACKPRKGKAHPIALFVAPTRELAAQLGRELGWLFAALKKKVTVVTGGTPIHQERQELSRGPAVVVGTPGRLLDHMRNSALSLDDLIVLCLDEADEMLDMGFEEEIDAILEQAPEDRRTHLVSATFGGKAKRLADRLQKNPIEVEGTPLGEANTDIEHLCILVHPSDQLDAMVNLLLRFPDAKTLVFVRTRADTLALSQRLIDFGFAALPLSGEMTQRERTSAYGQFRKGTIRVLVATDVAARGLDVQDIEVVVQADLPENSDVMTHRSGRTGRAGRTGRNILLVTPRARRFALRLLQQAGMNARFVDVPSPEAIIEAADERLVEGLKQTEETSERMLALADRVLEDATPRDVVARLLERIDHTGPTRPRNVRTRSQRDTRKDARSARDSQERRPPPKRGPRDSDDRRSPRPAHKDSPRARTSDGKPPSRRTGATEGFTMFQVSWGQERGADPRRLLAIACRRGGVERGQVGAIRVAARSSTIEISESAASRFEKATGKPDPRDPHVRFRRWKPIGSRKPDSKGPHKGPRPTKHGDKDS